MLKIAKKNLKDQIISYLMLWCLGVGYTLWVKSQSGTPDSFMADVFPFLCLFILVVPFFVMGYTNQFYRKNLSWIIFLPISRKRMLFEHILFVAISFLTGLILSFAGFGLSIWIGLGPEFGKFLSFLTKKDFFNTIENISFSGLNVSIGMLCVSLFMLFFFGVFHKRYIFGHKRGEIPRKKMSMYLLILVVAIYTISNALIKNQLPMFIFTTVFCVGFTIALLDNFKAIFNLPTVWNKKTIRYSAVSVIVICGALFFVSKYNIQKAGSDIRLIEKEMANLGSFIRFVDISKGLKSKILADKNASSVYYALTNSKLSFREMSKRKLTIKEKWNRIDKTKFFEMKKLISHVGESYSDIKTLAWVFGKIKDLSFYSSRKDRLESHLLSRNFTNSEYIYLLGNDNTRLAKRAWSNLKFANDPHGLWGHLLKNFDGGKLRDIFDVRVLNGISFLLERRISTRELFTLFDGERSIASSQRNFDCSNLKIKKISEISKENIRFATYCSLQNRKKIGDRSFYSYPGLPLTRTEKNIFKNSLKLIDDTATTKK